MALSGIYDAGEMHTVEAEWAKVPTSAPVLANWNTVKAHLVAKQSTPYTANETHDFMHNKVLLCDDTVATGSYNFSTNAEGNAETSGHPLADARRPVRRIHHHPGVLRVAAGRVTTLGDLV